MAVSKIFAALIAVSGSFALTIRNPSNTTAPSAVTRNGTLVGRYEPAYDTDYFLGIPYAQPPVGDLRFRTPRSLNESWTGTRNATEYSPQCIGYGMDTWSQGNYVSEDCLTLNVIRTGGTSEGEKLPVMVWFHGGGLVMGGSSDRRYNQSFIVQQATEAGMPILAVSVNYRLSSWGFLYGKEIQEEGNAMNGFRDARLSLQWIQENIQAFGGDPDRVTIYGESAGGECTDARVGINVRLLTSPQVALSLRSCSHTMAAMTSSSHMPLPSPATQQDSEPSRQWRLGSLSSPESPPPSAVQMPQAPSHAFGQYQSRN